MTIGTERSGDVPLVRGRDGEIELGRLLGRGGVGSVYEVPREPDLVCKLFDRSVPHDIGELRRRLEAMVAGRPASWREPDSGHVLLAWPIDVVESTDQLLGFLMPRLDLTTAVEIHNISNLSDRRDPTTRAPGWIKGFTWHYHAQAASNLGLATSVLHDGDYVIGDFNERNVLVTPEARVTLIDCDSMQVPDPRGGVFRCEVGRPEFVAPEIGGTNTARAASSDLFPLAIHIHQLLLNEYPFDGIWTGPGDKPSRTALAKQGAYVFSEPSQLLPSRDSLGTGFLPSSLQELFHRAFVTGASSPEARPTGAEWKAALDEMIDTLVECPRDASHVYPGHHATCPWCARLTRARIQTALAPARPTVVRFPEPVTVPEDIVAVSSLMSARPRCLVPPHLRSEILPH
jgi:DNA-binding helix-hairpin-helix protein with protein kinase domain